MALVKKLQKQWYNPFSKKFFLSKSINVVNFSIE
jgi:hypothetical protein